MKSLLILFFSLCSCHQQQNILITYSHQISPHQLAYWQSRLESKLKFNTCSKECKILLNGDQVSLDYTYTFDERKEVVNFKAFGFWKTNDLNLIFSEINRRQSSSLNIIPPHTLQRIYDEVDDGQILLRNGQRVFELDFKSSPKQITFKDKYGVDIVVKVESVNRGFELNSEK